MGSLTRRAAVVGAYEFPARVIPGYTEPRLEAECAMAALNDAGLTLGDVDGYFGVTAPVESASATTMCDYLNINPKIVGDTNIGGATFVYNVLEAAALINAGLMNVALITYSQLSVSRGWGGGTGGRPATSASRSRAIPRAPWWTDAFDAPYGLVGVASYAQVAQRHMHEYGTTSEQLAEIAVSTRYNASFNPEAKYQSPITVEDVVNSRMICSPLHLLDCCVITDGGGAIVVTSPDVARGCKQPPVWLLGGAMAVEHRSAGYRDYGRIAAARSGPRAFADAGVTPDDIDLRMLYDSYTITALTTLEGLGFCGIGEGGPFVASKNMRFDGDFPLNTDGGGLSSNHPGARGMFLVIEATRQLRGKEGKSQVKNCKIALCHGTGLSLGTQHSGATIILTKD
jgi:acetyl-CoA C-acetyltransferase